jgi:hypothetical protein
MAELPARQDFDDFAAWTGRDVRDSAGERLGAVELIFLDEATGVPEWVLVDLGDGTAFVPLAGASVEEAAIQVKQERERVEAAPRLEARETISVAEVERLYEHYGIEYSREESPTVLPEGAGVEERPRLRRYVVGAPVAAPVPEEEPTAEKPATDKPATEKPATEKPATAKPAADAPAADRMAPRNLSSATASPIPPAPPRVTPPDGGFQSQEDEPSRSRVRLAIPAVLGGALAGLIAVLAFRRARR